jgi:hypothetical protein
MLSEFLGLMGFFTVHLLLGVVTVTAGAGGAWLTGRLLFRLR